MSYPHPYADDCPGCLEPIDDPATAYDPGHNYGCGWVNRRTGERSCHSLYCSKSCHDNACEASAERADQDFHSGAGPLPLDEQCRRAYLLKG